MFALSRSFRHFVRFPSNLHSTRSITSASQLLNASSNRFTNSSQHIVPIRTVSTKKLSSNDQINVSKIQLIAPHLRKASRRRRPLATLYKDEDNSLPKVIGMAKAESFDLCAIVEDDNFSSFYQVTFVDDGRPL